MQRKSRRKFCLPKRSQTYKGTHPNGKLQFQHLVNPENIKTAGSKKSFVHLITADNRGITHKSLQSYGQKIITSQNKNSATGLQLSSTTFRRLSIFGRPTVFEISCCMIERLTD